MDFNITLTPLINSILTRMAKDMPKKEMFRAFRENKNLEYGDLNQENINDLINTYINISGTIFDQRKYQEQFIELFIKYVLNGEDVNYVGKQNNKKNLLNPTNEKERNKLRAALLKMAYLMGNEITQTHMENVINLQSSVRTAQQTAKLKSQLEQGELLLVRGKSGKFDQFVSKDQLTHAIDNPDAATTLHNQLGGQIHAFNTFPRQRNVSKENSASLPIVIKSGSQLLANDIADLQSQLLIQEAVRHLEFLEANNFLLLENQMVIDAQTKKISAEMTDINGDRLLIRIQTMGEGPKYSISFLSGEYANKTMALTPKELEKLRQKKLTAGQIFQQISRLKSAEQQAKEDAHRRAFNDLSQKRSAQINRGKSVALGQGVIADSVLNSAANRANQIPLRKTTITRTVYQGKQPIKVSITSKPIISKSAKRIKRIRKKLREGKIVTGTLQVKKALNARHIENIRRQKEAQNGGSRASALQPKKPKSKKVPKGIAFASAGKVSSKKSRGAKWIGIAFGGGILGTAGGFSILDVLGIL